MPHKESLKHTPGHKPPRPGKKGSGKKGHGKKGPKGMKGPKKHGMGSVVHGRIETITSNAEFEKAIAGAKNSGAVMRFTDSSCGVKCKDIDAEYLKYSNQMTKVRFLTGDLKALAASAKEHRIDATKIKVSPAFVFFRTNGQTILVLGPDISSMKKGLGAVVGHPY